MKASPKILTLMLALAASSAFAAGTTAGTQINNVATATFSDPSGTSSTVDSNPVVTTVSPVPSFTITPNSIGPNTAPTTYAYTKIDVLPNSVQSFKYTITNTGNTPEVVNLTTQGNNLPGTVTYYSDAALTQVITATPAILPDGTYDVYQKYTVPAGAVGGSKYDADPVGTAKYDAAYKPGDSTSTTTTYTTVVPISSTNPAALTDNDNYNQVTVYTTNITPPSGPLVPGGSTVVIPPTTPGTPPADPTNPVSPPGTPTIGTDPKTTGYDGPPANPATPESPTNPGTSIAVSGNDQSAYTTTGQSQVTFTNNIHNGGTLADQVRVFPTDSSGNPIGTNNNNGSFTVNVPANGSTPAYSYTVTFTNANGSAATLITGIGGRQYPVFTAPAGGDVQYKTTVVFTPIVSDGTATNDPYQIPVTIGLSSGNKDLTVAPKADSSSKDTIVPPGLFFGDDNGGLPKPSDIGPGNAAQVVVPKAVKLATGAAPTSDTVTNATAVFPMDITNPGEYNDSFTLAKNTVTFKDAAGNDLTAVPVRYVYADGTAVPTDTNGNFVTKVVAANGSLTVYAVVDVPDGAVSTGGATGRPNPTFNQQVTGNYSGVSISDNNDQIQVGVVGGLTVVKQQSVTPAGGTAGAFTQSLASAKPGDALNYQIVVTNTYNGAVKNFILKDSNSTSSTINGVTVTTNAYTYTNFVSAIATITGFNGQNPALASSAILYSKNAGGNWTTAAPTSVDANGIWVAVDTDNSGTITAADVVPAGATITLTINTTVR